MLEDTISPELTEKIVSDYKNVVETIEEARGRVKAEAWTVHGSKPWTILNLIVSNELGVPKKKRVACAAVVDVGSRAVAITDDIIDEELPKTYETVWASRDCLLMTHDLLLRQMRVGLSIEACKQMLDVMRVQARTMWEGVRWQKQEGKSDNQNVTFQNYLAGYLDKICAPLFYWSILPVGIYHPQTKGRIAKILPAVKGFARIFQLEDDIEDVLYDYDKGQLTSALLFIRNQYKEFGKLKEEVSKTRRKLTSEEFAVLFPESYAQISSYIDAEKEFSANNLPAKYYEKISMLSNNIQAYKQLRARIDSKLYPIALPLPTQYTLKEKERIKDIYKKTRLAQENLAWRFVTAVAIAHEKRKSAE